MSEYVIIKLGGSVITTKDTGLSVRKDVVEKIGRELSKSGKNIILIHGAGSFGHPIAKKYGIKEGNRLQNITQERLMAASKTRAQVHQLHQEIIDIMLEFDLPIFSFPISSSSVAVSGKPKFHFEPVTIALAEGFIPVLYGDVVIDEEIGFTIISGDEIMYHLSDYLGNMVKEAIFISDVDGLFTGDPKTQADATLIEYHKGLDFSDILQFAGESAADDVTGGMRGKILNIARFLQIGISVKMLNGFDERNLNAALSTQKFKGSLFIP